MFNGKINLEKILNGQVPEYPPHFEQLFMLEKEFLGFDRNKLNSETHDVDFLIEKDLETKHFLIDELGWAAVYGLPMILNIDRIKQIKRVKDEVGHKALVFGFNGDCVFWMPTGSDIMDFVVMLFERPGEMHQKAKEKLRIGKELAVMQKDAGVDFLIMNSDFGFNSGPFISPDHFREFVTPYMTEFVGFAHDLGLPVIMHSDGNIAPILDQLYSTGVDGYQSIDPQAGMDLKAVREKYPDWILMGNVACNLLQSDDEEGIRQAVRDCMKYGGVGKRYIFGTSNTIFEGMPAENYKIMLDEYKLLCGGCPK